MHALNNVFVSGGTTLAPQQDVHELIIAPNMHIPFPLAEHSNGAEIASRRTDGFSGFRQKQAHKPLYLLLTVAIILLVSNMFFCRLNNSGNVQAGERVRRLARGEDGKEREEKAGSKVPDLCGLLDETVSSYQEKEGSGGGGKSSQKEGMPRQRKRKRKWLEGTVERTTSAKPGKR